MILSELIEKIGDREIVIGPRLLKIDNGGRSYISRDYRGMQVVMVAVELRPGDKGIFE